MKGSRWVICLVFATLSLACGKREAAAPAAASQPGSSAPASAPATPGALVADHVTVDGQPLEVRHSKWDMGQSSDMFDADPKTLARTENANPAVVEIVFPTPRPLKGISATTATMDVGLTVTVQPRGAAAKTYTKEFRGLGPDPTFGLDFDTGSTPIESVRVEIRNLGGGDGHIHIRTLKLS
jgi:hypothetical protein